MTGPLPDYIDALARMKTKLHALSRANGASFDPDRINYGHVGSLNEANRLLAEIMRFMNVTD